MIESLKELAERVPYPLGRALARVPMSLRLGPRYFEFKRGIQRQVTPDEIKAKHLREIRSLIQFAFDNVKFYHDFYERNDFSPSSVDSYEKIGTIPIVTKAVLREYSLAERSVAHLALKQVNTGGTTGQPLVFYVEKGAYAREWAHMHAIWGRLGYRHTDEKLTIRGTNVGCRYFTYRFNQNEFLINAYAPTRENVAACRELILKRHIQWIHGYPSSVVSFLRELEATEPALFDALIGRVRGVFLGSEYPAPQYRDYIEKRCGLQTLSWYGHSEMAILAPETYPGSGVYAPLHTYGFAEAQPEGDSYRLIATSTHNFATPLIRYDTGDLVNPALSAGLLDSFTIKEGRNSDYVVDGKGRRISLTALIFGRHHRAFNHSDHIQVRQEIPGKIEVLITSREVRDNWSDLFDFSNTYFDVSFRQIPWPIRTQLGKIQLLLRAA